MIIDGLLLFTGTSNGASGAPASGAYTDAPTTGTQESSNIVDLGLGTSSNPGIPSLANGGGARDIGIGDDPAMKLTVVVTVAFTVGTNMAVSLSGAPDNTSGAPGSYTIMWQGPTVLEASMIVGAYLANVDMPRTIPGQVLPRFLRLDYVTSGTHTLGQICGFLALDRFDQIGVSGYISGYPAGITVAN